MSMLNLNVKKLSERQNDMRRRQLDGIRARANCRFTQAEEREMCRLKRDGWILAEIAEEYGCTPQAVFYIIKRQSEGR